MISTPFGSDNDRFFMQQALAQAQKAYGANEVPIGAIVVDQQGTIIGRGYNQVERRHTQTAHAELIALTKAARRKKDWRLEGCWIYVTLEPCTMCIGLIQLSRIAGLLFGASSPLFGYRLDKDNPVQVYKKDTLITLEGVEAEPSIQLLKQFFQKQRKRRE